MFQLRMQIRKAQRKVYAEPMQAGEVGHVDNVHVTNDRGRQPACSQPT